MIVKILTRSPLPSSVALAGVRLLRRYLESPCPTPLATAIRLLQRLTLSSSSEVSV